MQRLKLALTCLLLASLAGLAVCVGLSVWRVQVALCALPAAFHVEMKDTRAALVGEVDATRSDLVSQIVGVRSDVRGIAGMADKRTGEALGIVRDTSEVLTNPATGAVATLNWQLSKFNGTLADTLKPVQQTAQQVNDAAPLWLDCEYNPDCAFNRYQGVAKAFEKTAQVVAAEAPRMTANVDKIAASSAGVANSADLTGKEVVKAAQKFNKPQTKMQQFRSWLLTIARIYGAI